MFFRSLESTSDLLIESRTFTRIVFFDIVYEMSTAHDPRTFQGTALTYACAPLGGKHTEGLTLGLELGGWARSELPYPKIGGDRSTTEGKT